VLSLLPYEKNMMMTFIWLLFKIIFEEKVLFLFLGFGILRPKRFLERSHSSVMDFQNIWVKKNFYREPKCFNFFSYGCSFNLEYFKNILNHLSPALNELLGRGRLQKITVFKMNKYIHFFVFSSGLSKFESYFQRSPSPRSLCSQFLNFLLTVGKQKYIYALTEE